MLDVAIVDYGMGNLRSVRNAFVSLGATVVVTDEPTGLGGAGRIVLPGVGAFGDGMATLTRVGWVDALEIEVRERGKPFLGLCLGMQLLASKGTEHGEHAGLGWVPGTVVRLSGDDGLRVPHIGWNDVTFDADPLYEGVVSPEPFYFVHSYVLEPDDPAVVSATCDYGVPFAAGVTDGNVYGTQFHPEKSQHAGLQLLRNFLAASC